MIKHANVTGIGYVAAGVLLGLGYLKRISTSQSSGLMDLLGGLKDPVAAGALAVGAQDQSARNVCVRPLMALLPQVTESHVEAWDESDRKVVLAALGPVAMYGGDEVLETVRKLAGHSEPDVAQAAAAALPAIERRAAQELDRAGLLRASGPAHDRELLRPAGDASDLPEQHLLRPSSNGDDSNP